MSWFTFVAFPAFRVTATLQATPCFLIAGAAAAKTRLACATGYQRISEESYVTAIETKRNFNLVIVIVLRRLISTEFCQIFRKKECHRFLRVALFNVVNRKTLLKVLINFLSMKCVTVCCYNFNNFKQF